MPRRKNNVQARTPRPINPAKLFAWQSRCQGRSDGKLRFVGEKAAATALRDARARRRKQNAPADRWEQRYYYCMKCSTKEEPSYHLTHLPLNVSGGPS